MKILLDSSDKEVERIRSKLKDKEKSFNLVIQEKENLRQEVLRKQEMVEDLEKEKERILEENLQEKENLVKIYESEMKNLEKSLAELEEDKRNLEESNLKIEKKINEKEKFYTKEIENLTKEKQEFIIKNQESEKNLEIWKDGLIQIIDNNIHFLSIMEERKTMFIKLRKDIWIPLTLTQKFEQKEILRTKNLIELEQRISM